MAQFLKNLISNAANSVSEGIKKRVDDGTFNRMASDFGDDVSSLAAGMVSIVGMAEKAFGKLKDKASDVKTQMDERAEERRLKEEQREQQRAAEREAQLAAREQAAAEHKANGEADAEDGYKPGVTPLDDHIARLANLFWLDDGDIKCFGMARLTVQTALFFACCDGDYTKRERKCVEAFIDMFCTETQGIEIEDEDGVTHELRIRSVFDGVERPYTIDEIIQLTHRLVDDMSDSDRNDAINLIDYLAQEVVEADNREDTVTEDYYEQWRSEFMY